MKECATDEAGELRREEILKAELRLLPFIPRAAKALEEFEVAAPAFLRKLSGPCVAAGEPSAVYCINAAEG